MRDKVRAILKEWLQSKDDIVFTDDIAIEEVTDEIVEACRQECTMPVVSGSLPLAIQLLKRAKCPDCDGSGTVVYNCTPAGEIGDIGPCQWCWERDGLVGNDR